MSKDKELEELLNLGEECRQQMNSIFRKRKMNTPKLNKLPDEEREEWLRLHEVLNGISDDICKLINRYK